MLARVSHIIHLDVFKHTINTIQALHLMLHMK